jgi:adenylosuccinate lyase
MASENILMEAVKRGGDRQVLHEKIRQYSMGGRPPVKEDACLTICWSHCGRSGLCPRQQELDRLLDPSAFIGRAPEQVDAFFVRRGRTLAGVQS